MVDVVRGPVKLRTHRRHPISQTCASFFAVFLHGKTTIKPRLQLSILCSIWLMSYDNSVGLYKLHNRVIPCFC